MSIDKKEKKILKKHKIHHTVKHMNMMKDKMKKGVSFTKAHSKAQRKVGT